MEVELGWGAHDLSDRPHLSDDGSIERAYLEKLLEKTEECEIPVSFDIVGHLLLEACDGSHEGPYPDGWFDGDPGTDVETDPLFYAPDVAERIVESDVDHELCTHTFSHVLCDDVSDELLETELRRVRDLHEAVDDTVTSFVPPRHQRPDNAVLARNGIRTVRYAREKTSASPAHRFKQLTIGPHPEWRPRIRDDILETYCTTYPSLTARSIPGGQRQPVDQPFRSIPLRARASAHQYYLRRSVNQCIRSEVPLHLWCHLYDLSNEPQWRLVSDFLEFLSNVPEEDLQVETMAEFAEGVFEESASTHPHVQLR